MTKLNKKNKATSSIIQMSYAASDIEDSRIYPSSPKSPAVPIANQAILINKRSPYQRDRDRLIHSFAFRRLKHKTQVFVSPQNESFRTRLTHTLEVAQIARSIARGLGVNEDLTEAISLAHDLGHPPFGHSGEQALDQLCKEYFKSHPGFNHNDQTLRVITKLEKAYIHHDGLNLSIKCLEGIIKHNGRLNDKKINNYPNIKHFYFQNKTKLVFNLTDQPSLEAQIAAASDDIAYNHHDLEDGVLAKIISIDLIQNKLPFIKETINTIKHDYKNYQLTDMQLAKEIKRRLISISIDDIISNTKKNIDKYDIVNNIDILNCPHNIVCHSTEYQIVMKSLRGFLYENLYLNAELSGEKENGQLVIKQIFEYLVKDPNRLKKHSTIYNSKDHQTNIIDFIANLTDNLAKKFVNDIA